MPDSSVRVVFVCLGNICRSPLAEYIVAAEAEAQGLAQHFVFSSAGTGDWHVGRGADQRMLATAMQHGLDMREHRAQQITSGCLHRWDWYVVMDAQNKRDILQMGAPEERVLMMRQRDPDLARSPDVPDPYYGGGDGFEHVYRILEQNASAILELLQANEQARQISLN